MNENINNNKVFLEDESLELLDTLTAVIGGIKK